MMRENLKAASVAKKFLNLFSELSNRIWSLGLIKQKQKTELQVFSAVPAYQHVEHSANIISVTTVLYVAKIGERCFWFEVGKWTRFLGRPLRAHNTGISKGNVWLVPSNAFTSIHLPQKGLRKVGRNRCCAG